MAAASSANLANKDWATSKVVLQPAQYHQTNLAKQRAQVQNFVAALHCRERAATNERQGHQQAHQARCGPRR